MILARYSQPFEATLDGATAGLLGTIAVQVQDDTGAVLTARTTVGIREIGGGVYAATLTAPTDVQVPPGTDGFGRALVRWDEGDPTNPDQVAAEDVVLEEAGVPGAVPTIADVSGLLQARIRGPGGSQPPTFDDTTKPTAGQIFAILEMQAALVYADVGSLADDAFVADARQEDKDNVRTAVRALIAARTAAVVEMSYWPEEVGSSGVSAQAYWQQLVSVDQPSVVAAAKEARMGGVVPGDEQTVLGPVGDYGPPAQTYDPNDPELPVQLLPGQGWLSRDW